MRLSECSKNISKNFLSVFRMPGTHSRIDSIRFENFENLSLAYEVLINQLKKKEAIPPSPIRPRLLFRLLGTSPFEAYFIIESLSQTKSVDGDVCEFGVAQGETSALIANEISDSGKMLHLFDSFKGLPKPTGKDKLKNDIFSLGSIEAYEGTMSCPESMVVSRLQAISFSPRRYIIHRGFVEHSIGSDSRLPEKVSFAYVDFDFYEPIKTALEFLHRVCPAGAVIIVDDYDFFSTGAKTAVDEFVLEKNAAVKAYDVLIPDKRLGYFAVLSKNDSVGT